MVANPQRVIEVQFASTRTIPAYGGTALSEDFLELLADALRANRLPLQFQHDPMRPLEARCLSAEIAGLPDGHKALRARFEVDPQTWRAWEAECAQAGVQGGLSFTFARYFAEVGPPEDASQLAFSVAADAVYFSDEAITAAGRGLAQVGNVKLGRLYQFADPSTSRIIVEFLRGGPASIVWGVVSAALYDCVRKLIAARRVERTEPDRVSQIEFHERIHAHESSERVFLVRSEDEKVLKHAIDAIEGIPGSPDQRLEWNADSREWRPPQ